jgi:branched-chain amino acid transport system permease protein
VTEFLEFTVTGIVLGSIYAVTASGLVVTYTTTGIFNFAQGAVGMIAAFSFYQLWQAWQWPLVLSVAVVLLVEMPLLAVVVEIVFMRRLYGASTVRTLMVTLGLLLILIALATAVWNPVVLRIVPSFFAITDQVGVFGVNVSYQEVLTILVAVVMAVGLWAFFRVFRIGVAMRAVVDDPNLVALAGAKPYRISQMGWALGFFMAGVAGVLLSATVSTTGLDISTLTLLVVNGYAAAVVGRLRSLPLTFVGALALGLTVQYANGYLPGHIPTSLEPVIQEIIPVVFLFVTLLVLPAARLAAAGRLPSFAPPRVATFRRSLVGAGVVVVAAVVVAQLMSGLSLDTMSLGLALGIVGLSMVLLTGYAGQVSLCQLTIAGVGAFTMGKVAGGSSWWGLLAGVGASAVLGALLALPAIRLRGLYMALATLAFAEAAYYAFFQNPSVFGAFGGNVFVGRLGLFGMKGVGDRVDMVEIAVAFGLSAVLVLAIRRSPTGRRMVALSDSPAAFATLGMSANRSRVLVFAVSAGLAGLGGCLYAGQQGGISANDVQFFASLTLLLLVTIAGIRTVTGALVGGLAAAWLPSAQTHLPRAFAGLAGLVAGVGIVLLGRSPDGVIGMALPWLRRRTDGSAGTDGTAGADGGGPTAAAQPRSDPDVSGEPIRVAG